jgi:hypothetical protein
MGMAGGGVVVAAPFHAYYRNFHPLHEGRNFYSQAAAELTRRWHEQSGAALAAVGGDDGLAFATAFYSPDHPVYEERLVVPHTEALPRHATFDRGWAALCYDGDTGCIASMEGIAARGTRFVRTEFVIHSTLFGQPGASQGFTALMVPPFDAQKTTPPASPAPSIADAGREGATVLIRQDVRQVEPTYCAPSPSADSAESRSEFVLPPIMSNGRDGKRARHAAPAIADQANWPDRGTSSSSASRDCFARWPISARRANASIASRGFGARPTFSTCHRGGGKSDRAGRERVADAMSQLLSVRFKHKFCAMAADFDAGVRRPQENFTAGTAREPVGCQLQLWRGTPDPQRRGTLVGERDGATPSLALGFRAAAGHRRRIAARHHHHRRIVRLANIDAVYNAGDLSADRPAAAVIRA